MIFSEQKVEIRRALMRLSVGKEIEIKKNAAQTDEIAEYAKRLAKVQNREFVVVAGDGSVIIQEVEPIKRPPGRPAIPPDKLKYPIGDLEPGNSVLIDLPRTEHAKVRNTASAWAQRKGWRLSCSVEGSAIRITRTA